MSRAAGLWALLASSFLALGGACGARTALRPGEPCLFEGETRACSGICGEGIVTCEAGYWSKCVIPLVEEACEDVCGTGSRTCENEVWSECRVPETVTTCSNDCGTGTRTCVDRIFGPCEVAPVERTCTRGCEEGTEACIDGVWGPCDAPAPLPPVLTATIRDFHSWHPDFEQNLAFSSVDEGIVRDRLGPDDKPVYAHGEQGTPTTNGEKLFNQWYREAYDESGEPVSLSTEIELQLTPSPSEPEFYVYGNSTAGRNQFFPIDDQLFGNFAPYVHNYHFTLEASAEFVYREGQVFRFQGDDDLWVFVNRKLAIDLGGLHTAERGEVAIDDIARETDMVPGERYGLHIFFAERQSIHSNFYIETSIADVGQCE